MRKQILELMTPLQLLSYNESHIIWKKKTSKTATAVKYDLPARAFKTDSAN